jgi:ATP-binding cassette subfamily F protein uup
MPSNVLISTRFVSKSYGAQPLFTDISLQVLDNERLGLIGPNGAGKSTFLKILADMEPADSGEISRKRNTHMIYLPQEDVLDPEKTIEETLLHTIPKELKAWQVSKRRQEIINLIEVDNTNQKVKTLSGGEKARVLIANLMLQPADILLLDEPTNDLDIPTLEVLEESLEEFPGAIVLITHDRFLMERLCDLLLYLDGDGGAEFFADYDQWLQYRKGRLSATPQSGETSQSPPKKKPGKLAYEERKELNRIEGQIEKAEGIADNLQRELHDPEITCDAHRLAEIYAEHQEAQKKVEQLYQRWEELETGESS